MSNDAHFNEMMIVSLQSIKKIILVQKSLRKKKSRVEW